MFSQLRCFTVFSNKVEEKLRKAFSPVHMQVQTSDQVGNEQLQTEEYLNVKLVSKKFEGMELLERHQLVHTVLADEILRVHALNLNLMTPDQWSQEKEKETAKGEKKDKA